MCHLTSNNFPNKKCIEIEKRVSKQSEIFYSFLLRVLENLVYLGVTQKSKEMCPFSVILETISNNESGLSVLNTYFQTLP